MLLLASSKNIDEFLKKIPNQPTWDKIVLDLKDEAWNQMQMISKTKDVKGAIKNIEEYAKSIEESNNKFSEKLASVEDGLIHLDLDWDFRTQE